MPPSEDDSNPDRDDSNTPELSAEVLSKLETSREQRESGKTISAKAVRERIPPPDSDTDEDSGQSIVAADVAADVIPSDTDHTEVEYTTQAATQLENLHHESADQIANKVDDAAEFTESRLEKLKNHDYHKIRAGDYRAIVTWKKDSNKLIVEAVGHRRNIYDRHVPP